VVQTRDAEVAGPSGVDDLLALRAIETLKYRYLRCVDLRRWDELAETLVPDATASYGGGSMTCEGRDAIVDFLRERMPTEVLSSHRCHHPEIDLLGPDEATGRWALDDVVIDQRFSVSVRGSAYYEDRYVRTDGGWRIAHTGYSRIYEEIVPRPPADDGGPTLTAHWWDTGGRSSLEP
jgi:hypothetical protein